MPRGTSSSSWPSGAARPGPGAGPSRASGVVFDPGTVSKAAAVATRDRWAEGHDDSEGPRAWRPGSPLQLAGPPARRELKFRRVALMRHVTHETSEDGNLMVSSVIFTFSS